MYETNITFPGGHPKKLQTIGFPVPGEVDPDPLTAESNVVLLNFLSQLEEYLSVNSTALNYTALWDQTKPDPGLPSIPIFLNSTYIELISLEQTMLVRKPFFADYASVHDGRKPFVDPVPLVRLNHQYMGKGKTSKTNTLTGTLGGRRLATRIRIRCCNHQQDHIYGLVGQPCCGQCNGLLRRYHFV